MRGRKRKRKITGLTGGHAHIEAAGVFDASVAMGGAIVGGESLGLGIVPIGEI